MTTTRKPRGPRPGSEDPDPTTTGENLRAIRIARGFTQRQIAEELGYSAHNGWTHIESGRSIISDTDLRTVASFMGVAPSVIRNPKAAR
jgi:transcriptional regulator with XRE-family HTH domain